jgi:hypothetical protein
MAASPALLALQAATAARALTQLLAPRQFLLPLAAAAGEAGRFLRWQQAAAAAVVRAAWGALELLLWAAPAGYLLPQLMVLAVKA